MDLKPFRDCAPLVTSKTVITQEDQLKPEIGYDGQVTS